MRLLHESERPLRRRLWVCASLVGILVATIVVDEAVARLTEPSHRLELGGDFVPAYVAGMLVREGRARELYQPEVVERLERQVVKEADLEPLPFYGPYLNPPFFAAVFAPLSALSYRQAALVWLCFNIACVAGALVLLCRMLPPREGWRTWGLVPLLLIISMPCIQAMCHLQNTGLSLLLLSGVVWYWRAGPSRPLAAIGAGLLAGLLAYKPQLAVVVAIVLVLTVGWRAWVGLCSTGCVLLGLTLWKLPGTLGVYASELPRAVAFIQNRPSYNWGRQVTPQAFWRLMIQGHSGGPANLSIQVFSYLAVALGAFAMVVCIWSYWKSPKFNSLDLLIASTIASMPLLVPYYMDYDLLLLAVPAVLVAGETITKAHTSSHVNRLWPWAWGALFVALYVNPGLSSQSRINLAAPLVGLVAWLLMFRCLRQRRAGESAIDSATCERALAA